MLNLLQRFRLDLQKNITFLKVEYVSPLSIVQIEFDPDDMIILFYVLLPFLVIPYIITAYALPPLRSYYFDMLHDIPYYLKENIMNIYAP